MFGKVDLYFVHFFVTPENLLHNYLIAPKMFFETVKFGYPPTLVRSIHVSYGNA